MGFARPQKQRSRLHQALSISISYFLLKNFLATSMLASCTRILESTFPMRYPSTLVTIHNLSCTSVTAHPCSLR